MLAACAEEHRSAALLKIPFDDFLAAAKRRAEAALLRRIEFCCAMPVLRHTPFKELHLLCSYMAEADYEPGAFITCQGKEATHVHIVLQGEVRALPATRQYIGPPNASPRAQYIYSDIIMNQKQKSVVFQSIRIQCLSVADLLERRSSFEPSSASIEYRGQRVATVYHRRSVDSSVAASHLAVVPAAAAGGHHPGRV